MKEIINPRGQNVAAPNAIKPAKAKLMTMPPTTPVAVAGLLQQQHIAVRCNEEELEYIQNNKIKFLRFDVARWCVNN